MAYRERPLPSEEKTGHHRADTLAQRPAQPNPGSTTRYSRHKQPIPSSSKSQRPSKPQAHSTHTSHSHPTPPPTSKIAKKVDTPLADALSSRQSVGRGLRDHARWRAENDPMRSETTLTIGWSSRVRAAVGVETAFWRNDSVLTPLRPRYERRNPDEIAADPRCPTAEVLHGTLCRLARIAPITATLASPKFPLANARTTASSRPEQRARGLPTGLGCSPTSRRRGSSTRYSATWPRPPNRSPPSTPHHHAAEPNRHATRPPATDRDPPQTRRSEPNPRRPGIGPACTDLPCTLSTCGRYKPDVSMGGLHRRSRTSLWTRLRDGVVARAA
jgi:hypothetical protein